MARVYYKRAMVDLAPLVGGLDLLDVDPWLVIDNAREEIVRLRLKNASLRALVRYPEVVTTTRPNGQPRQHKHVGYGDYDPPLPEGHKL